MNKVARLLFRGRKHQSTTNRLGGICTLTTLMPRCRVRRAGERDLAPRWGVKHTLYKCGSSKKNSTNAISWNQPELRAMLQKDASRCLRWVDTYAIIGDNCRGLGVLLEFFRSEFEDCSKRRILWHLQHPERQLRVRCKHNLELHLRQDKEARRMRQRSARRHVTVVSALTLFGAAAAMAALALAGPRFPGDATQVR